MSDQAVTLPRTVVRSMSRGGDAYDINVAWPSQPAPRDGFPVLYLLDANAIFATFVESVRTRSHRTESTGVVPMVVVGIGYPTDGPYDRGRRTSDYAPWPAAPSGTPTPAPPAPSLPAGDAFLDFLLADVRGAVESAHAIDPRRQTLVGHSLGGLCVLHALVTRGAAFQRYVAISPSLWWNAAALRDELARSPLRGMAGGERPALLTAVGEYEEALAPWQRGIDTDAVRARRAERRMIAHARAFTAEARALGLDARCLEIAGEDHSSVVAASLGPVLRFASQR